jgi:hypothetical protein
MQVEALLQRAHCGEIAEHEVQLVAEDRYEPKLQVRQA